MCDEIRPMKSWTWKIVFYYNFAKHGLAKLLIIHSITKDHPRSKLHSPWPVGVGGPWNLKNHWISPRLRVFKSLSQSALKHQFGILSVVHKLERDFQKLKIQKFVWDMKFESKVEPILIYWIWNSRHKWFYFKRSLLVGTSLMWSMSWLRVKPIWKS